MTMTDPIADMLTRLLVDPIDPSAYLQSFLRLHGEIKLRIHLGLQDLAQPNRLESAAELDRVFGSELAVRCNTPSRETPTMAPNLRPSFCQSRFCAVRQVAAVQ